MTAAPYGERLDRDLHRAIAQTGARDRAAALLASATHRNRDELRDVVRNLDDSLDQELWIDGNTLEPKHGEKVFEREEKAVDALVDLKRDGDLPAALVQPLIDALRTPTEFWLRMPSHPRWRPQASRGRSRKRGRGWRGPRPLARPALRAGDRGLRARLGRSAGGRRAASSSRALTAGLPEGPGHRVFEHHQVKRLVGVRRGRVTDG